MHRNRATFGTKEQILIELKEFLSSDISDTDNPLILVRLAEMPLPPGGKFETMTGLCCVVSNISYVDGERQVEWLPFPIPPATQEKIIELLEDMNDAGWYICELNSVITL